MESKPHAKPAPAALVKAITAPGGVLPTSKGAPTNPLGAWGAAALSLSAFSFLKCLPLPENNRHPGHRNQ